MPVSIFPVHTDNDSIKHTNCWHTDFITNSIILKKKKQYKNINKMKYPMKDEYLLPSIADGMIRDGVSFTVLPTDDKWFGVTYQEDKPAETESVRKLIEEGIYRADLYSDL